MMTRPLRAGWPRGQINERKPAGGGHAGSGRKTFHSPSVTIAAITNAVVQPALAALPELDDLGSDAVATPMAGKRHLVSREALGRLTGAFLQLGPIRNHFALMRGPGAQPAAERPAPEIRV